MNEENKVFTIHPSADSLSDWTLKFDRRDGRLFFATVDVFTKYFSIHESLLKTENTSFKRFFYHTIVQIYLEQIKGIKVTRPSLRPDLAVVRCTATDLTTAGK